MIKVENVSKVYKVPILSDGRFSAIKNLVHPRYENKVVVNSINFEVDDGEIVGYIGPNGAGKSTTIKMLSGILTPSSGNIQVNGINPHQDRLQNAMNIGVVFGQKTSLWWDVPVIDSYKLLKEMYHLSDDVFNKNLRDYVDMLDMGGFINQPVRQLSLGQRMRADMAAALLHNPKVLFLDEPTIGLDVVAKESLRSFIKELNATQKVTVLITTHDMIDLEKMANRLIVIDSGNIFYNGDLDTLRDKYDTKRVIELTLGEPVGMLQIPHLQELSESTSTHKLLEFDRRQVAVEQVIAQLAKLPHKILNISIQKTDIEDIIRNIYRRNL